jgi:hypothetical protein
VRWGPLVVLLGLPAPASAARIAVNCYDGASSAAVRWGTVRPTVMRLGVCDRDGGLNGRCEFRVSLGAPNETLSRVFEVTLDAGGRQRLRHGRTAVPATSPRRRVAVEVQ